MRIERFAEGLADSLFELLEAADRFDMGIVGVAKYSAQPSGGGVS